MRSKPLITVIVPTHDHASTLDYALGSVIDQTVNEFDVVVIGDGVGDDTRAVMHEFESDRRVRFMDRPKSPSRAEEVRHQVIERSRAPFVAYLGDDDLMLPDHLETMVGLLEHADFTHPAPLYVLPDGRLQAHPIDLSSGACRQWQLNPIYNAVSLSGVVHRRDTYLTLPHGWRIAPAGRWSDDYMWEQWFRVPWCRFVTGTRLTVIKLESGARRGTPPAERRVEIAEWKTRSEAPGFDTELVGLVSDAWRRWAIQARLDLAGFEVRLAAQATTLERVQAELARAKSAGSEGGSSPEPV